MRTTWVGLLTGSGFDPAAAPFSWTESSVTWNSAPSLTTPLGSLGLATVLNTRLNTVYPRQLEVVST